MALYQHGQAWTLHRCVGPVSGHGHAGLNGTVSVLFRARSGQLLCQDIPYSAIVKPECEQQARMIAVTGFEMRATSTSATRKTARLSLRLPEAQDINFTADRFSRNSSRIVPILTQTHQKRAPLALRETWPIGKITASGDGQR